MKHLPHLPTDEIAPNDSSFGTSTLESKVVTTLPVNEDAAYFAPVEDPLEKTGAIPIQPPIESPFEIVPEDEIIPLNPFAELPLQAAMGQ